MTFFRFFSLVVVLSVMMAAPSYARQTIGTQTLLERYTTAVEQGETQGARDVALQLSSSDFSDTPLGLSAREVRSVKMELAEELAEMGFFEDGISILSPLLEKDEAELSNTTDPVGRTALLNAYFERLSLMGQLATQQGEFDRTIVARGKAVAALQRLYFGSFVAGIDKLDTFPDIDSAGVVSIDLISREDRWARTPDNRFLRKFYDNQTRQAVSDLFAALDRRAFANEQSGNSVRALIDLYRMRSLAREQCAFGFSDVCAADGTLLLSMTDTARRIAAQ
jgi:hypothetical protein